MPKLVFWETLCPVGASQSYFDSNPTGVLTVNEHEKNYNFNTLSGLPCFRRWSRESWEGCNVY